MLYQVQMLWALIPCPQSLYKSFVAYDESQTAIQNWPIHDGMMPPWKPPALSYILLDTINKFKKMVHKILFHAYIKTAIAGPPPPLMFDKTI